MPIVWVALGLFGVLLLGSASRAYAATPRATLPYGTVSRIPSPLIGASTMRGKALFIRNFRSINRDPVTAAVKYISWGYTWAVIPWIWQSSGGIRKVNQDADFYEALRARGIPFYLMVYPERTGWQATVRDTCVAAKQLGAVGVLLDAETPWQRQPEEATQLAAYTRRFCRAFGLEVGLTSLGSAQVQRNFPYESFAPYMDFAIPQLYDPSLKLNQAYFTDAYARWRQLGFHNLILGLSEYERTTCDDGNGEHCQRERAETKTPSVMQRYLNAASAALHPQAVILWTDVGKPDRQVEIRNWRI